MGLAVASPAEASTPKKTTKFKAPTVAKAVKVVARKTGTVPSTYKVVDGDTISSVAGTYGLSTASVLALNGLGWKSLIYPGQVLKLSKAAASSGTAAAASLTDYTIASGDTVSTIAKKFGVSTVSVLAANKLTSKSLIFAGEKISVPAAGSYSSVDVDTVATAIPASSVKKISATTYVIATGDTMTSVAAKFGVSVHSLLETNGLTATSLIYAGRSITIPTKSAVVSGEGVVTLLTEEMRTNASTIVSVGRSLGVSDYGLVVALATAMQESGLRNLAYGDRDSVGLFQQRPSKGWGTVEQILSPTYAARAFFLGVNDDTPGLVDIGGWKLMTVTQAAQAVQVSAHPNAYAQWEKSARYWLDVVG
jgi:LysM repeat protein